MVFGGRYDTFDQNFNKCLPKIACIFQTVATFCPKRGCNLLFQPPASFTYEYEGHLQIIQPILHIFAKDKYSEVNFTQDKRTLKRKMQYFSAILVLLVPLLTWHRFCITLRVLIKSLTKFCRILHLFTFSITTTSVRCDDSFFLSQL